jgi:hypothetical protein
MGGGFAAGVDSAWEHQSLDPAVNRWADITLFSLPELAVVMM